MIRTTRKTGLLECPRPKGTGSCSCLCSIKVDCLNETRNAQSEAAGELPTGSRAQGMLTRSSGDGSQSREISLVEGGQSQMRFGFGAGLCRAAAAAPFFKADHTEDQKPGQKLSALPVSQANIPEHQAVKYTEAKKEE